MNIDDELKKNRERIDYYANAIKRIAKLFKAIEKENNPYVPFSKEIIQEGNEILTMKDEV